MAPEKATRKPRRRKQGPPEPRGLTARQVGSGTPPNEVVRLMETIEQHGGTVIGPYREPLSGLWQVMAALPIEIVEPTPYQRDLSEPHVKRLAEAMEKLGRYMDPIVAVPADGKYWTPNGFHRLAALKSLGARAVFALVVPEPEVGHRILILNIEKAHNIRERALEVIRLAQALVERHAVFHREHPEPNVAALGRVVQSPDLPETVFQKHWDPFKYYELNGATELPYWKSVCEGPAQMLPLDFPEGVNDEASACTLEMSLDVDQTQALLRDVPAVYNTQMNDALLAGLARTFSDWTGDQTTLINLEGHGREAIFADVNLWRTPGWFTTHFPVKLRLEGFDEIGRDLKSVKEQLRAIPNHGIDFGLLRYLSRVGETRSQLSNPSQTNVSFNYLGQFDEVLSDAAVFRPARESCGARRSPRGLRSHVLEITAGVYGGALQISWQYSENLYRRETIEMLAENFVAALESIVAHCQAPDAGGFTPSDFPEAALSQQELDRL